MTIHIPEINSNMRFESLDAYLMVKYNILHSRYTFDLSEDPIKIFCPNGKLIDELNVDIKKQNALKVAAQNLKKAMGNSESETLKILELKINLEIALKQLDSDKKIDHWIIVPNEVKRATKSIKQCYIADEVFFMQLHALQAKYKKPVDSTSRNDGAEEALKDFEDNIFKPGKIIVHANPNHPYFKELNKYIEGNLITHSNELTAFHNNDQLDKAFKDSTQKVARLSQGRFLSFHRMDTPIPAWIYIVQAENGLTYYQATWNKTEVQIKEIFAPESLKSIEWIAPKYPPPKKTAWI